MPKAIGRKATAQTPDNREIQQHAGHGDHHVLLPLPLAKPAEFPDFSQPLRKLMLEVSSVSCTSITRFVPPAKSVSRLAAANRSSSDPAGLSTSGSVGIFTSSLAGAAASSCVVFAPGSRQMPTRQQRKHHQHAHHARVQAHFFEHYKPPPLLSYAGRPGRQISPPSLPPAKRTVQRRAPCKTVLSPGNMREQYAAAKRF